MTNLEYIRMKIPDKDTNNQIFTDAELQQIIKDNSEIRLIVAEPKDFEGKIYQIPYRHLDETYTERVFIDSVETTDFTLDKETGEITFTNAVNGIVVVQAKVIDWNNVLADCYEMIMGDFQKLNSYSIQNASQQYDNTKPHLRYLANYYRSARGWDL
ncbi:hypothetical protein HNP65_000311 [Thermosipho japonicus]|uniref:Uncharacterized protein n=1 Tax=Thermosipho japonicus TaxID=90323 RepID=A0A841GQI9_9BACT|nr:hypothetical protein [Thermosipho japonicus]MBB6061889.1 hypothetical protein [Thermosipho japonicus]